MLCVTPTDATIFASNRTLRATVRCLSWDFQRSPLRRTLLKSPLPPRHRCRRFEMSGATVHLRSVFAVSHRPDSFRLFNPAHVLQCAADHEVRDVSTVCDAASPSRDPALRSLLPVPSALLHFRAEEWMHVTSPFPNCSPCTLPSRSSPRTGFTAKCHQIRG